MSERLERPWLPENYRNFSRSSQQFARIDNIRLAVCAVTAIASTFIIPPEYRNFVNGLVVGLAAGLLTEPDWPSLNIWGRRLYLERHRLAQDISAEEKWPTSGISGDQLIKRAKATLTLAGELAPLQKSFKPTLTPDQRILDFDKQFCQTDLLARPGDNRDNMNLAVARRALTIAEDYWQSINPASPISQTMIENIKRYRSYLSIERHISFQNYH